MYVKTEDCWYLVEPEVVVYKPSANGITAIDNTIVEGVQIDWSEYWENKGVIRKVYDGDIQGYRRYIRYLEPKQFSFNFDVVFFDIEVNYSLDTVNTPDPIVSVIAIDESKNITQWSLDLFFEHKEEFQRQALDRENLPPNSVYLKVITAELIMIDEIIVFLCSFPGYCGWNSINYDERYLANRYRRLAGFDHWAVGRKFKDDIPIIKFTSSLDYRNITMKLGNFMSKFIEGTEAEKIPAKNFRLNTIAKLCLQETKIDIDIRSASLEDLLKYNIQDVMILYKLEKKMKQIYGLKLLHFFTGLNIGNLWESSIADAVLVRAYTHVPMPPVRWRMKENFPGGFVFTPKPGIYQDVKVLDFASLYPNIMITKDISPVRYKGKGIFKPILKWLLGLRGKFAIGKDDGSQGDFEFTMEMNMKTVGNTFFGVLGSENFRLTNYVEATRITQTGQMAIKLLATICENLGFIVIYGDTDSVFVFGVQQSDIDYINKRLAAEIGDRFIIKIDKTFRTFAIGTGKKMYTGITDKGKFSQAGWLKGNVPMVIRQAAVIAIKELDRLVMIGEGTKDEWARKAALVGRIHIEKHEKIEDFGISVDLKKHLHEYTGNPAHVRAQKIGNIISKYEKYGRHNPMPYIKINRVKPNDVLPSDMVKLREIDFMYYLKRYDGFMRILMAFNYSLPLDDFF